MHGQDFLNIPKTAPESSNLPSADWCPPGCCLKSCQPNCPLRATPNSCPMPLRWHGLQPQPHNTRSGTIALPVATKNRNNRLDNYRHHYYHSTSRLIALCHWQHCNSCPTSQHAGHRDSCTGTKTSAHPSTISRLNSLCDHYFGLNYQFALPGMAPLRPAENMRQLLTSYNLSRIPVAITGYHEPSTVFNLGTSTKLTDLTRVIHHASSQPDAIAIVPSEQTAQLMQRLLETTDSRILGHIDGLNYSKGKAIGLDVIHTTQLSQSKPQDTAQ
jgi:hypothetical protein